MKSKLIPFFCDDDEDFRHICSLNERISKQQLLSAYHNDDSLPIKRLDGPGELTVRIYAAHVRSHIIAHVLALFFRPF
jgi:hypothetical protein